MVNLDEIVEQISKTLRDFNFSSLKYMERYINGEFDIACIISGFIVTIGFEEKRIFMCINIIDNLDKVEDRLKNPILKDALTLNTHNDFGGYSGLCDNRLIYYLYIEYDEFIFDNVIDKEKLRYECAIGIKELLLAFKNILCNNNLELNEENIADINAAITPVVNKYNPVKSKDDEVSNTTCQKASTKELNHSYNLHVSLESEADAPKPEYEPSDAYKEYFNDYMPELNSDNFILPVSYNTEAEEIDSMYRAKGYRGPYELSYTRKVLGTDNVVRAEKPHCVKVDFRQYNTFVKTMASLYDMSVTEYLTKLIMKDYEKNHERFYKAMCKSIKMENE